MFNNIKNSKFKNQRGVAVIITILFITVLSSIVISLAAIILPRIRIAGEVKRSVGAIYAADSAIEWCLYLSKANVASPIMENLSTYTITPAPNPPVTNCSTPGSPAVKAVGTFQGVTRSLEISGF